MKRLVGDPTFLGCVRAPQLQRLQRSCHTMRERALMIFSAHHYPVASTTQSQLE